MASIIGEKAFNNADGNGWNVTDKIFGYLDKSAEIYNDVRYPHPEGEDLIQAEMQLRMQNTGLFGMQRPWGAVILFGAIALVGFGIYNIAK